jgi:hypothetical protein
MLSINIFGIIFGCIIGLIILAIFSYNFFKSNIKICFSIKLIGSIVILSIVAWIIQIIANVLI